MKAYPLAGGWDSLNRPSTADRIIGSLESDRATKTYINSEEGAILLAFILKHARGVVRRVLDTHNRRAKNLQKAGIKLEQLEAQFPTAGEHWLWTLTWKPSGDKSDPPVSRCVLDYYPGAAGWQEVHQTLVEHYASQEGFAVQATVAMAKKQLMEDQQQAESSISASKEKPPNA